MKKHFCRFCNNELRNTFVDLGMSPLANSYIPFANRDCGQMTYPLHVRVCDECFLVQLEEFESPKEIFSQYAYFSSYSSSWLRHAEHYVEYVMNRFCIDNHSKVVEIACNDGYLLQYFEKKNIPVLGIEPAENVAKVAEQKNIPVIKDFFGKRLAYDIVNGGIKANLLLGNNVLAHVPDINDFVEGMNILLADDGIITVEFPHILNLIEKKQFDTIYHEHFSYLSMLAVEKIFKAHSLRIFDVEEIATHGGSLRIFACHTNCDKFEETLNVSALRDKETRFGLHSINTYINFSESVKQTKMQLLSCLIELKRKKKIIVGYGAAAKGNTLLNYCGIKCDFLDYVVDKNPVKQKTLLPGSGIPVYPPSKILETKPDYIFILPWNITDEIKKDLSYVREWGAKFITAIPDLLID